MEISPVCAPDGSGWQFCAPSAIALPASVSATTGSAVNGGHTATIAATFRFKPSRTAAASARASACMPCIFQLPMTSGVLIAAPP